jgi:hypothetical protein
MKNVVLSALLVVLTSTICFSSDVKMATQEFPKEQMKKQKTEVAKLMAKGMAKNLPQKIDAYTVLTDITSKGSTLFYTFEINTGVKKDETIIKEDHSRMQRAVTKGVCQSSSKLLEAGINTTYIYVSAKTKKTLFRFDITQSRCISLK